MAAKQPKHFLLENVAGLLSHDNGQTFRIIIAALDEIGYDLEWTVINSKHHGVPQNRERVFIVGHFRGKCSGQVFSLGESDDKSDGQSQDVAYCLDANYQKGCNNVAPSLNARARQDGSQQGVVTIPVLTPDRFEKRQNGRRMKDDGEPSFTLTAQDRHGVMADRRIRRLTPTECARLQAFPDEWADFGINEKGETYGISDTGKYQVFGNAVTTSVIEAIVVAMLREGCLDFI